MQYQLITNSSYVKMIEADGTMRFVPNDPANSDWAAYQAWLAADPENNIPLPADE